MEELFQRESVERKSEGRTIEGKEVMRMVQGSQVCSKAEIKEP